MRRIFLILIAALLCLSTGTSYAQKKNKHSKKAGPVDNSAEPDKVLYARAMADMKRGHQEVARLTLQTLINTYPDSEFLAKAKLAIADSYYKEGGTANWAQAIAGYKDFIVFFPFLPEAPYAQLQVAMVHFREMEKPDRDRAHSRAAEDEFQTFLQKYPNDPLAPKAEQRLREVQEMLAEGDFRIANFYYIKGSYRASAARLITVTNRYPLFSHSDRALWMLGTIFEKSERKDLAASSYASIVRNYPLSGLTDSAKRKLTALKVPIPQPDSQALARMQQERSANHRGGGMIHKATGILRTGPDVQTAATVGKPNLEPEPASSSGVDILKPGGKNGPGGSTTGIVATVTPGSAASAPASTGGATSGAESTGGSSGDSSGASPGSSASGDAGAATSSQPENPNGAATASDKGQAAADSKPADGQGATPKAGDGKASPDDKKKESSSKKKKGLRKIIPW
ncbi:MAG TPA: outer membrane protein assembly factor BamD [Candidatus Acidoferrum sp.]|nr:outer membrane protein assembly factor BamD [Candidatus Acidoferrum sp.]